MLALDDTINPKTGKKIFGCASFFDHAAKTNQSKYPWSQNVVSIGLLKNCQRPLGLLTAGVSFLSHGKTIATKKVRVEGKIPSFQTKFEQAIEMLLEISAAFPGTHC
ncbi:MAG: hypothetical protein IPH22_12845 [Nitrosomonas sp.]|nr:hypothetical protein [Nitrosomonas sp.]